MSGGYRKPQENDFPLLFLQDSIYFLFLDFTALHMMKKGRAVQKKVENARAICFVELKSCFL